jgi:small GTP-binding protein
MDKTLHLVDVKVVLVGDGSVGKTSLLISYTKDVFSEDYDPTVFDHFMTTVRVGNHGVKLSMWDTPGQGEYDRFRPLAYSSADIFLICFAIDDPMSLDNALSKWVD